MSADRIDEVFGVTETFDFWVAQPVLVPTGRTGTGLPLMLAAIRLSQSSIFLSSVATSY